MCDEFGFNLINHDAIFQRKDLINKNRLHLNAEGARKVHKNFFRHVKNIFSSRGSFTQNQDTPEGNSDGGDTLSFSLTSEIPPNNSIRFRKLISDMRLRNIDTLNINIAHINPIPGWGSEGWLFRLRGKFIRPLPNSQTT